MKISSNPIHNPININKLNNAERLYQQPGSNINPENNIAETSSQKTDDFLNISGKKVLEPADILSKKEIEALQMMFGAKSENKNAFYGNAGLKNAQPGILMDIKG